MDLPMDQDKLKNLIANFMPEKLQGNEIEPFIQQLHKHLIEQALQSEMDAHLGFDRYERHSSTNSRNGRSKKTLKNDKDPNPISVTRDHDGSFEPQIIPKGQTRTGVLDPENRGIYTQSDSSKKSSRNSWSLDVVSVDQRY